MFSVIGFGVKVVLTIFVLLVSYIVGAIPTGYLVARMAGVHDIRKHGSGGTGATNVARLLGTRYFFLILLLDACKAYGMLVLLARYGVTLPVVYATAFCLLLGNCWSLFLGSSSGKGIATSAGILCALAPVSMLVLLSVWASTLVISRIVGVASVITVVMLPLVLWYNAPMDGWFQLLVYGMTAIILIRHKQNILTWYHRWVYGSNKA